MQIFTEFEQKYVARRYDPHTPAYRQLRAEFPSGNKAIFQQHGERYVFCKVDHLSEDELVELTQVYGIVNPLWGHPQTGKTILVFLQYATNRNGTVSTVL